MTTKITNYIHCRSEIGKTELSFEVICLIEPYLDGTVVVQLQGKLDSLK